MLYYEYMKMDATSETAMVDLGEQLGRQLEGGEVIELVGDVGAGKTTFTRGLARGLGVDDDIQSPTFTISRIYEAPSGLRLVHYDFYRLIDARIMAMELEETVGDEQTVTVIEWGEVVASVLPRERITITITASGEATRSLEVSAVGERLKVMIEGLV